MKQIWIICRRELASFFDSLMAYIMIIAFLGFSGFFTWLYIADVFYSQQASLQIFFDIAFWTLFFFIPALTMGQIAEENRSGTIEFLLTKPIKDSHVILGEIPGYATSYLHCPGINNSLLHYCSKHRSGRPWCCYLGIHWTYSYECGIHKHWDFC